MDNKKVTIIDYGLGNLFSIAQAIRHSGGIPVITSDKKDILSASHLILPGVGAFGQAMESLNKLDLITPIFDYVNQGKPLMGVCLGMQILFEESEEFGFNKGLGLIKGQIKRFSSTSGSKVPQVGWNQIYQVMPDDWKNSPLRNVRNREFMYFVHSYYAIPTDDSVILTKSNYANIEYCSSVKKENVTAFQFHPEKSGKEGLSIYKEFIMS